MDGIRKWAQKKLKFLWIDLTGIISGMIGILNIKFGALPSAVSTLAIIVSCLSLLFGGSLTLIIIFSYIQKIKEFAKKINQICMFIDEIQTSVNDYNTYIMNVEKYIKEIIPQIKKISDFIEDQGSAYAEIKQDISSINASLYKKSNFRFVTSNVTDELKGVLKANEKANIIRIICYGRKGYEEVVEHICTNSKARENNGRKIDIDIIMCHPDENPEVCSKEDAGNIKNQIEVMVKHKKGYKGNVNIYVSEIPPAIRASTVYIDDKPIWSVTQAYQLEKYVTGSEPEKKLKFIRPDKSVIAICDESDREDLTDVVSCFHAEFARLISKGKQVVMKNGKPDYIDIDEEIKEKWEKYIS